jgi:Septum formation initiator
VAAIEPNSPGSADPGDLAHHRELVPSAVQNLLAHQTREINLLKTDATYLETVARDRLDLMKEGETIFRLEPARAEKPKPSNSKRR